MPAPSLVRVKAPPLIPPLKVNSPAPPALLFAARVMAPLRLAAVPSLLMSEPLRVSASAPIAWPNKSSVAPEATVVPAPVPPKALALPNFRVPLATVVMPL